VPIAAEASQRAGVLFDGQLTLLPHSQLMILDLFYHQFEQVLEPIGFLKTQSDGLAETGDGIAPLSSFDISQVLTQLCFTE
jgi:hypothetical protein